MIDFITELQNLFKRCAFHVVGISKPDSPEFLHFIWMKLNKQQFGSCFKKKDFQFRENLYINKFDFEQTSILIELCVIPHTSTIKRTITAMASPCLVLPSNITNTSLVEPPFCLKIRVIYCPRLYQLLVRRCPFYSSRESSLSILLMGIPAFRNSFTTSCLYAWSAKGSQCGVLTTFLSTECLFDETISLQASQKIFVPLTIRC